jgi:hypothetical protein
LLFYSSAYDTTPVPFEITNTQTEVVIVEKTNQAMSVSGGSSGPYNPGTPNTGVTPDPGKPTTPEPGTPEPSIPGTVVTEPTEPEGGTEIPTDEDNGGLLRHLAFRTVTTQHLQLGIQMHRMGIVY